MNCLKLSFKDFFTFKFLMFSFAPLIASSVLFIILLWYSIKLIASIDIDEQAFNFFLGVYILHAIQIIVLTITSIAGGAFALYLSVFFAVFITSFLTPFIVKEINLKHYNYIKNNEVSILRIIWTITKLFLKFIILFLLSLLLYIIPVINFFAPIIMFLLLFYLYYQFLIIDVASCVLNKYDFLKFDLLKSIYITPIFIFYLIFHIPVIGPFIGFFSQVFFVIYLSHLIFNNELKLKSVWLDYK